MEQDHYELMDLVELGRRINRWTDEIAVLEKHHVEISQIVKLREQIREASTVYARRANAAGTF